MPLVRKTGAGVSASVVSGSKVNLTPSGTTLTVTSIVVPAGKHLVFGKLNIAGAATTTLSFLFGGLSLVAATVDTTPGRFVAAPIVPGQAPFAGGNEFSIDISPMSFTFTVATTVYLVAQASFGVSTIGAYGYLECVKVG